MSNEAAGRASWPEGIKRTKPRERVLAVLQAAARPLTAADIHAELARQGGEVWLSTVYRTLDLFEQKALVLKTVVHGGGMALYSLSRRRHEHYAVCMRCHTTIPLQSCPLQRFDAVLKENGFTVLGHELGIYGYCRQCADKDDPAT